MYKSFEVNDFRCFNHLAIPTLGRINLIAGLNNVGKTAFLEAVFLHCGAYNPALAIQLSMFRTGETKIDLNNLSQAPWNSIFRNFDTSRSVRLSGDIESTGRRTLTLRAAGQVAELVDLGKYFAETPDKQTSPSQSVKLLELEYDQVGKHGNVDLLVDSKGMARIEPALQPAPVP